MIAYRICERKGDKLLTLFHGINGSRVMPIDAWMTANKKLVQDGNRKTSKKYLSGFHCLVDIDECRDFINKFRVQRDFVLVECEIDDTWEKTHSRHNVLLAGKMKLVRVVEKLYIQEKYRLN